MFQPIFSCTRAGFTHSLSLCLFLFIAGGLSSCTSIGQNDSSSSIEIPAATYPADHPRLSKSGGRLLLDNEPFSGWIEARYPSGELKSKSPYWQGKLEGTATGWYENGHLQFERKYVTGRKHDIHLGWYADGTQHFEYRFVEGKNEGNHKEWMASGQLYRDFNYVNGHEDGAQKMYKSDGRILANYVVRNGRKYGLTGVSNCDPVTQSNEKLP